jgi:hypothetical protein
MKRQSTFYTERVIPVDPKFHQVAMYCGSLETMSKAIDSFTMMGFDQWTRDISHLEGEMFGKPARSIAHMAFNYQILPGIEYELLHYEGDKRWADDMPPTAQFISHLSYHVDDAIEEMRRLLPIFGHPVQTFETHDHTNVAIRGKKRFREVIYPTADLFGHDIKIIERIEWGEG